MNLTLLLVWITATVVAALVLWMFAVRLRSIRAAEAVGGGVATAAGLDRREPAAPSREESRDLLDSIELEALSESRLSTIVSQLGERLASADITLYVRTPVDLQLERAWIAVPGGVAARPHLEVADAPFELDADGRCLKQKPQIRSNEQQKVSIFHSWVPRGASVAESDEAIPLLVTLDINAPERGIRRSVRLLCELGTPTENRLYVDAAKQTLLQKVFERSVVSLHLVSD